MLAGDFKSHLSGLIDKGKSPIAVAFSGGGDSTALLYLVLKWANNTRPVHALIVDHGLRKGSAQDTKLAAKTAQKMGAQTRILKWCGPKPKTGIQEQARLARYGLMGAECRRLGASFLLLGHNRDDQAETLLMRARSGSGWRGLAGMKAKVYAPIWPQLYDVEIIRPLLDIDRSELRAFNRQNALAFLDDPANQDKKFTRVRARAELGDQPGISAQLIKTAKASQTLLGEELADISALINTHVKVLNWGGVRVSKAVAKYDKGLLAEVLKVLILAVSGSAQAADLEKRQRLAREICTPGFQGATLGGAQFIPRKDNILIIRDPGMVLGRTQKPALKKQPAGTNMPLVWDGRFLMRTLHPRLSVAPLANYADQLSQQARRKLKAIPLPSRATLPAFVNGDKLVGTPFEKNNDEFQISFLGKQRLLALGLY